MPYFLNAQFLCDLRLGLNRPLKMGHNGHWTELLNFPSSLTLKVFASLGLSEQNSHMFMVSGNCASTCPSVASVFQQQSWLPGSWHLQIHVYLGIGILKIPPWPCCRRHWPLHIPSPIHSSSFLPIQRKGQRLISSSLSTVTLLPFLLLPLTIQCNNSLLGHLQQTFITPTLNSSLVSSHIKSHQTPVLLCPLWQVVRADGIVYMFPSLFRSSHK